jgi:hypothetical protein
LVTGQPFARCRLIADENWQAYASTTIFPLAGARRLRVQALRRTPRRVHMLHAGVTLAAASLDVVDAQGTPGRA